MPYPKNKFTTIQILSYTEFLYRMNYIKKFQAQMDRVNHAFLFNYSVTCPEVPVMKRKFKNLMISYNTKNNTDNIHKFRKNITFHNFALSYMELLSNAMRDKNRYVAWFVLETNWGKKNNDVMLDGKFIKINDIKNLYELLVRKLD